MPLAKIVFKPGVNKESTSYGNEMGWFDSSLIRFRKGRPEKLGGWIKLSSDTILGTVRSLFNWVTLDGTKYMGVGTSEKFLIEEGGTYNDVTPLRSTQTGLSNPFTSTNTSSVLLVTDASHGAAEGDYVTFSGASTFNGVAATAINTNLQIKSVTSSSTYTVDTGDAASSSGTGGGTVTAKYEINTGLNQTLGGTGWGAGSWGGYVDDVDSNTLNGAVNTTATSVTLTSATNFALPSDTTLSADIEITSSTIGVADSSSFPSQGTIKVGSENIIYRTNASNILGDLTRGADGTTAATGSSGAAVSFLGLININNELILYDTVSSNTLDDITRAVRGTKAYSGTDRTSPTEANPSHSDGDTVLEANAFTGWGNSVQISATTNQLRLWFQDNFGEDLAFNAIDDAPFYWDKTLGVGTRATGLSAQSGASNTPTITRQIMVSGTDRHLLCFGCNELGSTTQNLLHVRWSDQENPFEWTPTVTNTAGGITLSSGSEIIRAIKTRQEILIYTDINTHVMKFIGPPLVFGFTMVGSNTSLIAPNAVVSVADQVFWMSRENFYIYNGRFQIIPCTVLRYLFDDLNNNQTQKITAGSNKMFDEVFWFYPSADSEENNRYVKYNYVEQTWDIGELSRTAWVDYGVHSFPRAGGADSGTERVYVHETSNSADGLAMNSFVESADFDLDPDGNNFMLVSRIIPDVSLNSGGVVDFVLKTRNFPGDTLATNSTNSILPTTQQSFTRARARQIALRIQSTNLESTWTLGDTRLDLRPDGRR